MSLPASPWLYPPPKKSPGISQSATGNLTFSPGALSAKANDHQGGWGSGGTHLHQGLDHILAVQLEEVPQEGEGGGPRGEKAFARGTLPPQGEKDAAQNEEQKQDGHHLHLECQILQQDTHIDYLEGPQSMAL